MRHLVAWAFAQSLLTMRLLHLLFFNPFGDSSQCLLQTLGIAPESEPQIGIHPKLFSRHDQNPFLYAQVFRHLSRITAAPQSRPRNSPRTWRNMREETAVRRQPR